MSRIVVGLSGGVDSALAAALLQERGFDVVGCFLKVAIDSAPCPWESDLPMAHRVAAHLNIPLIVRDVSAEYTRDVLEPMISAYRRWETPNPDATCNRYVKFDALAAVAREVGAERIATGHYARIKHSSFRASEASREISQRDAEEYVELWRGLDHVKDQSYFLWSLTQEQLAMCEFPLGGWLKGDVRAEAQRRGFPNWNRESTSGVCFLGQVKLSELLASPRWSLRGSASDRSNLDVDRLGTSAKVITTVGETIGTVPIAEALTIGQRAPIAGQPSPRYVVATEPEEQRVTVSATPEDPARYTTTVRAAGQNWIGSAPTFPFRATARIRHRQEPQPCTVTANDHGRLIITLDSPLAGVAPGQAVVLTDGDRVLGGAVIARP